MDEAHLKTALRRRNGLGAFWFATGSPTLIELSLPAEPQAIVIDLQHGLWDRRSLEAAVGQIPDTLPTIVRLADGSAGAIGEALDAGAEGVLVPLVERAAEAADCVHAAHYPPHGRRSGGGIRPLARNFAGYVERARRRTTIGVMIETAAGVEQAEAIAATPGLDFVFIGTGDLALSLGCFPKIDARHEAACRRVLQACQAADLPCGIFTGTPEEAARRQREGYALVVVANDIALISSGFRAAQASFTTEPIQAGA
jgi:2-keto-3-deoxy-L-rhamnonate aldolase RhmA